MAQSIVRAIHRIVYYVCIIGMACLLIMMLLTTGDVVGRSIFLRPIPGTVEITQFMLSVIVLLGLAYAQQTRQHVRVDLFISKFAPLYRIIIDIIFTLMAFVFIALLAWQGWEGGFTAVELETTSDILKFPTYPFEFLVAIGAFLLAIELLLKVIKSVNGLVKGQLEEGGTGTGEMTA